jgi:hypothetical protein
VSINHPTVYELEMLAASVLAAARRDQANNKSYAGGVRVIEARQALVDAIDAVDIFELQQYAEQDAKDISDAADDKLELLVLSDMRREDASTAFLAIQ